MAFPRFSPPKIPDAPSVPRNRNIGDIFKPKSSKVPSVTGQGKVDAPRIQMLIETYRTNPNGVRNLYLNMPEDAQMNLLMEIAREFPPARPGEPLSGVGQELFEFLESGEGVADSSVRRQVLMDDNRDAMRPGPSASKGDSFVTKENSDGPLGVTGDERGDQLTTLEIDEFLDNPEATGSIDKSPPDNPQNRYSKAANDAAALGYTKGRLSEGENFRGTERVATVEDGQPTNQSIPSTGRPSDSADMERSLAGQEYAQGQIDRNADTKYADMVAEKDNSSYFDSYQKGIVGMMNNSRNPDSLGGNRIDQLWGLISKTGDDPRTMFGSAEAMADVMLGHVNPKMVDNMTNPSPIGQQLPASQRSRMSYELIKEQLVKHINQKYANADGTTGFGAASAADLGKTDILEPDGVNNLDAELDAVTPVDDLDDVPESRYRPDESGRLESAKANQQERFDLFQERMDEIMAEGLTVDEAMTVMENEGIGQEFLQAGMDGVELVDRYGREMPPPPPPRSVKAAQEQKIGANGPNPPPPPTIKKGIEQPLNLKEAIGILKRNAVDPTGMLADDIIREATNIQMNKQANGKVPLQNTNKKPSKGDLGKAETKTNKGDLDSTSEGDQIDSNESAATDLPDDSKKTDTKPKDNEGKKTDTDGFNFDTDKDGKPLKKTKETEQPPGWFGKGTTSRKLGYGALATGGIPLTLLGLAGLNRQGLKPAGNGPEEAEPNEGGGTGATEPALPAGMGSNGGFERDADGSLSDAGLKAFLDQQRLRRSRGPRINTGTQTMGNWVR